MKKYFYHNGVDKFGPFTKEELQQAGITAETQIWYDGLPNWVSASTIEELSSLFTAQVPPISSSVPPVTPLQVPNYSQQQSSSQNTAQQRPTIPPPSNLVWGILTTIFCCLPFGIVSIIYAGKVESTFYAGNYDLAKKYSKQAATWAIVAASACVLFLIIYFGVIAAAIGVEGMFYL